jgi:cysteine desulfurase
VIYLDHNATTPLDERVREAMAPVLGAFYGNPSGLYRLGRMSRTAIDTAREQVAALAGARAAEVIFTSGGTEANNLAIKGMAMALPRGLALGGGAEHPAVSETLRFLPAWGWRVEFLEMDALGQVRRESLEALEATELRFASVMLANNETGVITDISRLSERLRALGAYLHCDAVQAAGKIPLDFTASGAHALSLSSHKIYGPKGVGALVADRSLPLAPLLHGGGQELGMRSGTENVAGIVGFGKAAELARLELESRRQHLLELRRRLETGLRELPDLTLFAADAPRLPNTLQFSLRGYAGETLVMHLDRRGFALSSGSACAAGAGEPSPVLLAMGVEPETARGAVRVSLGKDTKGEEVDRLLATLQELAG